MWTRLMSAETCDVGLIGPSMDIMLIVFAML